eukprot:1011325-Pyramimonas_sp.AAC.1
MVPAQLLKPDTIKIDMLSFLGTQQVPTILAPSNTTKKNIAAIITLASRVDVQRSEDDLGRARLGRQSRQPGGRGGLNLLN